MEYKPLSLNKYAYQQEMNTTLGRTSWVPHSLPVFDYSLLVIRWSTGRDILV